MGPRESGRFAGALGIVLVLGQMTLSEIWTTGFPGGVVGIVAAMILAGFGLAFVFTAIYDGPRALGQLLKRNPHGQRFQH